MYKVIVKHLYEFCQEFENKNSVSLKSCNIFLHLSTFSYSNSSITVGPGLLLLRITFNMILVMNFFYSIHFSIHHIFSELHDR